MRETSLVLSFNRRLFDEVLAASLAGGGGGLFFIEFRFRVATSFLLIIEVFDEADIKIEGKGDVDEHEGDVFVALCLQDFVGQEADSKFYMIEALPEPTWPCPSNLRRFFSSVNRFSVWCRSMKNIAARMQAPRCSRRMKVIIWVCVTVFTIFRLRVSGKGRDKIRNNTTSKIRSQKKAMYAALIMGS